MSSLYDEAIDLIARGHTSEELLAFKPSTEAQEHFEDLVAREKNEGLLPGETEELDRLMELYRMLTLAKSRARLNLQQQALTAA
ncbi:MAG: hypothetical protein JNG86_19565 [Verrucomicrobiaceae bacterium]|nr:hypothetical protein [Verrucomicrobiaceae bacterium]